MVIITKIFLSPKFKIWFAPLFFSGPFCGFYRCGSAAFRIFRGGLSSPRRGWVKTVRTISIILEEVIETYLSLFGKPIPLPPVGPGVKFSA